MKIYEYTYNRESDTQGVFAISSVKSPAMQEMFVKFSEESKGKKEKEVSVKFSDDEKQIVYSAVLIPDKLIYRNSINGEEANVFFSSETIEQVQQDFMVNDLIHEVTLDHDEKTEDVKLIESWVIMDADNDKANVLGFDLPAGTWMVGQKVVDAELWEQYKNGDYNGFSIEGRFGLQDVEMNEQKTCESTDLNEIIDSLI